MSSGIHISAEDWLQRNFSQEDVAYGITLLESSSKHFRMFVLPLLLAISAVVVAAMWYQKDQLDLITLYDRIGYTVLIAVTAVGSLLLRIKPLSIRLVMAVVVVAYITHLLAAYYTEMANRIFNGKASSYELTVLALWLPLTYVISFVFLSPRTAIRAAIAIYLAISLPLVVLLEMDRDIVSRQIAIAIVLSQPIYIAVLWGVGLLKTYTRGIHDIAKNMSTAATVDALTGVANRRALDHVLESITKTHSERSVALLMLDVDHFKKINDTYGHNVGDDVLVKLADEANKHLRASDLIGRWGGEEFMIISLDQTGPQAMQIAERLRSELEKVVYPGVGSVTVSIGMTKYIPDEDIETFINRADEALYNAKRNGRNRVEGKF